MPARVRHASLTTLLNALLAAARFLISLLTVSMLIKYLGQTAYGLCLTITAMAGWLSITQAGLGQTFRNEAIRLRAIGSEGEISRVFSSAFALLLGVALLAGTLLSAIAHFVPWSAVLNDAVIDRDPRYPRLILACLWIALATAPLSVVRAAYSAFQMEFKLAAPLFAGFVTSFAFAAIGIHRDWGLVAVVSASLAGVPAGLALGMVLMPELISTRFSWHAVDLRSLRSLRGPSIWFLIIEIAAIFIFQADIFLVNLLLGPDRAAVYSLHLQLFFYVQSAAFLFVSPYWPALGEAWRLGERDWFRTRVQRLTRNTAMIAGSITAALLTAGPYLMHRWSHGQVAWDPLLAALMGANVLVQSITGVSATALGSLGVARDPALLVIFQAILNVSACFCLIQRFGVIGGAFGSLIAYALTSAWYVPWRLRRISHLRLAPI
jgi:O-antigen/teichoic acid export membrane protein